MKLGAFLVIAGGGIMLWFFVLPLVFATLAWLGGVFSVDWAFGGWGWAIGVFGGGIIYVIGQERIRKVRGQTNE